MKIALHNPTFLLENQEKNFCGYNYVFCYKYVDYIYVTDFRKLYKYREKLKEPLLENIRIISSIHELNKKADILLSFQGVPYKFFYRPPSAFKGMKIYHVMDYVFEPKKSYKNLKRAHVDYIMGYTDHSKYCKFFKKHYFFENKVITVPFGYGERFTKRVSFHSRLNKAIALGSVNPLNTTGNKDLKMYELFYSNETFTHKLRRAIVENRERWGDYIEDCLPTYPDIKNPYYDPVEQLNRYTMFINDAGLMNFPPARTYEGIACGCVMVAEKLPIWTAIGFEDRKNCILFEKGDYDQMIEQIKYYIEHIDELEQMHFAALELADRFSHEKVADMLFEKVEKAYQRQLETR